jgi:aerobic-type carbon monoxide dehydrogenase small subunit (CoxS/CutS family)
MIKLNVNGHAHSVDVEPEMPLLWVLRDELDMPGTKYGCGVAQCGACTVHVDGKAVRSCVTPVSSVAGKKVVTIEGLGAKGLNKIQQAWVEHEVPQCGYCQTGMIMAASALLAKNPRLAGYRRGNLNRAAAAPTRARCGGANPRRRRGEDDMSALPISAAALRPPPRSVRPRLEFSIASPRSRSARRPSR